MKKKLIALLSIAACAAGLCFAGCNSITNKPNNTHQHNFINYVSDGNATCTEDGTKTATCEHDGCSETDTITDIDSKLGHSFVNYVSDNNATCTEDGTKTATCEHDGCSITDTVTDAESAHHFYEDSTCIECGYPLTFELNADNASYNVSIFQKTVYDIIIPATYKGLPVTHIDDSAFWGCKINSITIPDSVTSIGDYAFYGCSIKNMTIPDSVTSIGNRTFSNCHIGEFIVDVNNSTYKSENNCLLSKDGKTLIEGFGNIIPDSVTSIGDYAFAARYISSITIPGNVTSIGKYAFDHCSILSNVNIASGVTSIGNSAFFACSELKNIIIPDSVTSIGSMAFSSCPIETATIPTHAIIEIKNKNLKTVIITSGDSIVSTAFSGCKELTSVTIPDSVSSIGERAFDGCSGLTSITIPDGVTSIGISTFSDCSKLTSITIPDSVTSIGSYAFSRCSALTSITFEGTIAQWEAVKKEATWHYYTDNYTVQCTDGKLDREGNVIE